MADDIDREELAIYATAIAVLVPVVIVQILQHASFEGGATLCLLGTLWGLAMLAQRGRMRPTLPSARTRSLL
jgi:hypothetical protein